MITCECCREAGKTFTVPYDSVGIEIMKAHLKDEHRHEA